MVVNLVARRESRLSSNHELLMLLFSCNSATKLINLFDLVTILDHIRTKRKFVQAILNAKIDKNTDAEILLRCFEAVQHMGIFGQGEFLIKSIVDLGHKRSSINRNSLACTNFANRLTKEGFYLCPCLS